MKSNFKAKRVIIPAVFALLLAIAATAPASARNRPAPSGNSAVNQYLETIPGAGGSTPTSGVHRHPGGGHNGGSGSQAGGGSSGGGGAGGAGGSGSGGTGGGAAGGGAIPSATAKELAAQGSAGRAAAGLATALAPTSAAGVRGSTLPNVSSSPTADVLGALTGSSQGGLGALLPVLLIAAVLGGVSLALLHRRRASS